MTTKANTFTLPNEELRSLNYWRDTWSYGINKSCFPIYYNWTMTTDGCYRNSTKEPVDDNDILICPLPVIFVNSNWPLSILLPVPSFFVTHVEKLPLSAFRLVTRVERTESVFKSVTLVEKLPSVFACSELKLKFINYLYHWQNLHSYGKSTTDVWGNLWLGPDKAPWNIFQ